jgi:hypothetical protein
VREKDNFEEEIDGSKKDSCAQILGAQEDDLT